MIACQPLHRAGLFRRKRADGHIDRAIEAIPAPFVQEMAFFVERKGVDKQPPLLRKRRSLPEGVLPAQRSCLLSAGNRPCIRKFSFSRNQSRCLEFDQAERMEGSPLAMQGGRGNRQSRGTASFPRAASLSLWMIRLAVFLLGGCAARSLLAQDNAPLRTTPPLSAAFPLVQQGNDVRVGYPVAISEYVVVRPEARLHFLYVRPQRAKASGGESMPSGRRRGGGMGMGGMRMGGMGLGGMRMGTTDGMPSGARRKGGQAGTPRQPKIDRTTVWTSCDAFREALSRLNGSDLRLVFSLPAPPVRDPEPVEEGEGEPGEETRPQPRRVRDEPLSLPLGLLLAQRKGAPTVLAVEEASAGEQAGLRVKDRIASLDGRPCPKSLAAFLALYRQEKARGLKELTVVVERAGTLTPVSLTIPLPPRLDGSILDTVSE